MSDAHEYSVRRHDGMFIGIIELTPDEFREYLTLADGGFLVRLAQLPAREFLALQPIYEDTPASELVYLTPGVGNV